MARLLLGTIILILDLLAAEFGFAQLTPSLQDFAGLTNPQDHDSSLCQRIVRRCHHDASRVAFSSFRLHSVAKWVFGRWRMWSKQQTDAVTGYEDGVRFHDDLLRDGHVIDLYGADRITGDRINGPAPPAIENTGGTIHAS